MSPDSAGLLSAYSTLAEEHLSAQTQLGVIDTLKAALAGAGSDEVAKADVVALATVLQEHAEVTHVAYTQAAALVAAATGARRMARRRP